MLWIQDNVYYLRWPCRESQRITVLIEEMLSLITESAINNIPFSATPFRGMFRERVLLLTDSLGAR